MKRITEADSYVCSLSNEVIDIAREELRETPSMREHSIKAMRDWLETNPRIISVRLDSSFLLRFLRAKKFSLPMAQDSMERYLLLRQSYQCKLFQNMDISLTPLRELIERGYIFALPKRDKFGRRVIFTRPGVFDPNKNLNTDLLKMHGLTYETLMENEENQIRGFVHIIDATSVNLSYMTIFTPKEAVRIVKNAERTLPMRHKEINGIHVHPSIKFAVDFALGLITDKMKNRIRLFTSMNAADNIDKSILPREYGGTVPMAEMIDLWIDEVKKNQKTILLNDEMCVRLEMYSSKAREGAVSALSQKYTCSPGEDPALHGLQGSFRKLEVD